jgi:hypothetical protein
MPTIRGGWRIWLLGAVCATGCRGLFGSQGLPADPLFAGRKPAETRPETAAPVQLAHVEPAMPESPLLAAAKPPAPKTDGNVPGLLMSRPAPK